MPSTVSRTNETHRSAIARRLDKETGMGYQKALNTVREQADDLLRQLPVERLDGPGCDLLLRALMQQDIESWGPGIGAHMWPEFYHGLFMLLPGPMSDAASHAGNRVARLFPEQARSSGTFDPSWLAKEGVEPLDPYATPDDYDYDEDEDDGGASPVECEALDEPDRWKRHILAAGPRPAFTMPPQHLLTPDEHNALGRAGDAPTATRKALLEQITQERPMAVEAYILRAELTLPGPATTDPQADGAAGPAPSARELAESRDWFERAVVAGEQALHFFSGTLLWREKNNRPFLNALYGLAQVHFLRGSWNTGEQILFNLLALNPYDERQAGALLAKVRRAAGLPAPDGA
ncbi:hypothetical protein ACFWGI_32295 [Streptomyces niveus]|uniref:hypothetical protein n=1 Tax=Streptomyces niveus TaxID=193462 RepID=UPI003654196A